MPTLKGWVESAWKEISEGLASKHEKEAQNPYTGICKGVTTGRESWANRLPKLLTLQSILLRGKYYYVKVRAQCLKYNPFWPWHVVFNKQPFDWLRKRIWVFDQKWMRFSKNLNECFLRFDASKEIECQNLFMNFFYLFNNRTIETHYTSWHFEQKNKNSSLDSEVHEYYSFMQISWKPTFVGDSWVFHAP